jgi:hypothetical protein
MTNLTALQSRPVRTTPSVDHKAELARRGALLGGLAAVGWIAIGVDSIVGADVAHYRDAVWTIPWVLTYLMFLHLHLVQRSRIGPRGDKVFKILTVGMALTWAGSLGIVFDVAALKFLGFPLGALIWVVVLVFFGLSTMRAGVLPKYTGVVLILLEPCSMLTGLLLQPIAPIADRGAYSGCTEKGAFVAIIAFELYRYARRATAARALAR